MKKINIIAGAATFLLTAAMLNIQADRTVCTSQDCTAETLKKKGTQGCSCPKGRPGNTCMGTCKEVRDDATNKLEVKCLCNDDD